MGNDKELQNLIKCVEEKSIDHKDADLRKYSNVFNELAVVDGLVLRGERIVVPQTLREAMVKIAHEGHQGILRTKQLLRAHVYETKTWRWSFGTSMPGIQPLSLHQVLLLITSFPYLRACSTCTESPKRSNRIMGPRLMVQSLRTLLRNKGSDTERSLLGGLKLMVTWSVSCKPSRRVREFLNLKEKLFGWECKERLEAIAPRANQRQRKALTCPCSAESYGGSYRKGSYSQEKFHTTQSDKETRLKRSR